MLKSLFRAKGCDGDFFLFKDYDSVLESYPKATEILNIFDKLIEKSPECEEILSLWDEQRANRNNTHAAIIMDVLSSILKFSKKPVWKQKGIELCRIVMRNHGRQIYSYMGSDKQALVKKVLRLLQAIVGHSLTSAREFQEAFNFGFPGFQKLLHRRNKNDKEDIRTLYIYFMGTFLGYRDSLMTKKILETNGIFAPLFKGILGDKPLVVSLSAETNREKCYRAGRPKGKRQSKVYYTLKL